MFELKTLSPEAVPRALAKAERYRLLNEPGEAESICLDALEIVPNNQEAITMLLLAITEQFDADMTRVSDAWKTVDRLTDEYERAYYTRHHLRAAREGLPATRHAARRPSRLRVAPRGDGLLRKGGSAAAAEQRRCAPQVERLRPAHHERPSPGADERGTGRAAAPGIGGLPTARG